MTWYEQIIAGNYGIGMVFTGVLVGFLLGFFIGAALTVGTNFDYRRTLMWYMAGNEDKGKQARETLGYSD
ncbi:hypothetical protein LCGC14_1227850 [marine sediment metagenome]|uniref:Uncharacterized protein n=1 Tax=marine sediment metagenome TaxID=412755 RepID=A0A0F9LWJ9_9ZZZZ|nr:hypothetical protein [Candidatus Scalindua sp.]